MRWAIPLLTLIPALLCAETLESKLQHRLLTPCCYRETLDHHTSEAAAEMKAEIHRMIAAGRTEREIIESYKSRYGARILAEPEGAAWWIGTMTPLIAFALGTGVLVRLICKWSRASGAISGSIALLACLMLYSGCDRTSHPSAAMAKRYQLYGQVVRLDPEAQTAVIKHHKIEGWMEAMTMEFR